MPVTTSAAVFIGAGIVRLRQIAADVSDLDLVEELTSFADTLQDFIAGIEECERRAMAMNEEEGPKVVLQ